MVQERRGSSGRRAGARARGPARTGLACLVVGAAVGALVLVAPAAAAEDGLDETSHSTFVLQAGGSPVTVSVRTTLRNEHPDSGGYAYYWDGYSLPVPAGAQDVRASSGGTALPVTVEPTEDPAVLLAVTSFSPLSYGRERTIEWTYSLPGEPVRSAGYTRVGDGYATFTVLGAGDPGQVSVDVVVPGAMVFDSTSDAFTSAEQGETVTWSARESTDEYGIWAVVSARDLEAVDERAVEVGGTTLTLQSFPGDQEWIDFVEQQVTAGLPVLEEVVGHPWPGGLEVIREDVSPQVIGYAWFDPDADEIVIPEDLDEGLLFHELTHAWLDPVHIRERWLYEGLTEAVAERVVGRTGGTWETPAVPDRGSAVAVPLGAWTEPAGERAGEVDEYGYAASYTAVTDLVGDLDEETFTEIVAAAYAGESAYEDAGYTERNGGRTDWRRFLDLVEVRGGVADAGDVFRTWVLGDADAALLDQRAEALTSYRALDEADGAWSTPFGLRSAMTHWRYPAAEDVVAALGTAPADAAALQEAVSDAGLTEPASVREAYQEAADAEEYAAVAELLPRAVDVVGAVGEASRTAATDRDPVSGLGELVLGVDRSAAEARTLLAEGSLDAAEQAADATTGRAAAATWVGVAVVLLVVGAAVGTVLAVRTARRRRDRVEVGPVDPSRVVGGVRPPTVDEDGESADAGREENHVSTAPHEDRGTGEEQDWTDEAGRQAPEQAGGEPDIGTAGAFPALANDALPEDPDVPTQVDPGEPGRDASDEATPGGGLGTDPERGTD